MSERNLIDEFEKAFQDCVLSITKQEPNTGVFPDELALEVQQNMGRFMDLSRDMQTFFTQLDLTAAQLLPQNAIEALNDELKLEIERKDALLNKHNERLAQWSLSLTEMEEPQIDKIAGMVHPVMGPLEGHLQQFTPIGGLSPREDGSPAEVTVDWRYMIHGDPNVAYEGTIKRPGVVSYMNKQMQQDALNEKAAQAERQKLAAAEQMVATNIKQAINTQPQKIQQQKVVPAETKSTLKSVRLLPADQQQLARAQLMEYQRKLQLEMMTAGRGFSAEQVLKAQQIEMLKKKQQEIKPVARRATSEVMVKPRQMEQVRVMEEENKYTEQVSPNQELLMKARQMDQLRKMEQENKFVGATINPDILLRAETIEQLRKLQQENNNL